MVQSGSAALHVGRGFPGQIVAARRPSASDIDTAIVPVLRTALRERHGEVSTAAALSLGRVLRGFESDSKETCDSLIRALSHDDVRTRELATVALGLLGSPEAVDALRELLADSKIGRRHNRRSTGVEDQVRALAASALGLSGDREAIDDLVAVLENRSLRNRVDLNVLSVLALGQMPHRHEFIAQTLLEVMQNRYHHRLTRAQAPIALGALAAQGSETDFSWVVPVLLKSLESDNLEMDLRRSSVIALGQIASFDETRVVKALQRMAKQDTDEQTRAFAFIALAHIGGRDVADEEKEKAHRELERWFMEATIRPKRASLRSYAALASALYARGQDRSALRMRTGAKLLEVFEKCSNPTDQGALSIALGLLEYRGAKDTVWNRLRRTHDVELHGHLATALGMIGAPEHAGDLRRRLEDHRVDDERKLHIALALGLMGDAAAARSLVEQRGLCCRRCADLRAQSLGLLGDREAIAPLVTMTEDRRVDGIHKAFAVAALGQIGEISDLPWNAGFSVNVNYRAMTPALATVLEPK